jgi:hypothetical protein
MEMATQLLDESDDLFPKQIRLQLQAIRYGCDRIGSAE